MKILISVMFVMALLAGCSTAPIIVPPADQYSAQVQPTPRPDKALVYFFADQQFESGVFSITRGGQYAILNGNENGSEIAVLGCAPVYESRAIHHECSSYTWIYLMPGQYKLTAMFTDHHGTGKTRPVILAADTVSYFQVVQTPAAFSNDLYLVPVDSVDAVRVMSEGYKFMPSE